MKNKFGKVLGLILGLALVVSVAAYAVTVTNQGQVITVTTLDEVAADGTVLKDQSVYDSGADLRGLIVAHCKITASTSGSEVFGTVNVPKGAILLENGVIEVYEAVLPATSTNAITVGGVTVLATGTTLGSTGIKAAVSSAAITTSAGKAPLVISGSAATSGVFTVYLPYVRGMAQ